MVKSSCTMPVSVEAGGTGVVAHVGLHTLGSFADRIGLSDALSAVVAPTGEREFRHDRGKVLTQTMLMLAAGGEACSDIEALRAQPALFGEVASTTTTWRTFQQINAASLDRFTTAIATLRDKMWSHLETTTGEVVIDIDASLHEVHTETKTGTAPTYDGGYGFHPMYAFADHTGECLAHKLRSGNAAANNVGDHVEVLDAAIDALPADIAKGHRLGDPPEMVECAVRVRTDSAGATKFVSHCAARNIAFSVVARSNDAIHMAISRSRSDRTRWEPAINQQGVVADNGAEVAELSDLIDLSAWPPGTRFIVRRERLHPGAQRSLFASPNYRYWGHYTNTSLDPVESDADMRAHGHIEDNIKRLKASGAHRFPFKDLDANRAWLAVVCAADTLVRWFQLCCLPEPWCDVEPKKLRWAIWHAPARIVNHARQQTVRIINNWPTTDIICGAYHHIAAIP